MTSTAKTSVTANTAGLAEMTAVDAADVATPIGDLLTHVKNGRASVTAADTHVKHLADAFAFGVGLEAAVLSPGADERIEVKGKTAIAPFTVLGSPAANVDLTSIPATFDHLRLVLGLRTGGAVPAVNVQIRCNGDVASANYAGISTYLEHSAALTTFQQLESTVAGGRMIGVAPYDSAPAGYLGVIVADIYEYANSARPRTAYWQGLLRIGNASGEIRLTEGWFMWKNTADAINRLTVVNESGTNFVAGCGYGLYGIR